MSFDCSVRPKFPLPDSRFSRVSAAGYGNLLVMVRLATWTRRAGRATLGAIWLASLEARTRVEAIVSDVRGDMVEGRRSTLVKRKETGMDFFLNGRQEAGAGTRREEKREKSERERERKKENVWSESGPRVGEGNGLQVSGRIVSSHWPIAVWAEAFS